MKLLLPCFLILCLALPASANVAESYAFGSRAAALSGAVVAGENDGFASYYNPALMPQATEKITLSWGLVAMEPSFKPITGVQITNTYSSGSDTTGTVNTGYRTTFGQVLGATYRFDLPLRLSIGVTSFLPLSQLAYMDTGEIFAPEYVLHRARTQRPQVAMAAGIRLGNGLSLGAGVHFAFGMTASADVFLQSIDGKPSSMKFTTSLKPKAIPYLGLLFSQADSNPYAVGLTLRAPGTSSATMDLTSGVSIGGIGSTLDFIYHSDSAVYYDPMTLQLGSRIPWNPSQTTFFELDYEAWRLFKSPALVMTRDPNSAALQNSHNPTFSYQDILVPRVAHEFTVQATTLRAGYGYRPSIFKTLPTESGNYLDPPRHMANVGAGWKFAQCFGLNAACQFDLHASFQQLKTQHIDKTLGDEGGNPAGHKIGAPGYDAGGKIFGGGVSLSLKI